MEVGSPGPTTDRDRIELRLGWTALWSSGGDGLFWQITPSGRADGCDGIGSSSDPDHALSRSLC